MLGSLLKSTVDDKYDLILHGHMHKFFTAAYHGYSEANNGWHELGIIGAPSLSAMRTFCRSMHQTVSILYFFYNQPLRVKVISFNREYKRTTFSISKLGRKRNLLIINFNKSPTILLDITLFGSGNKGVAVLKHIIAEY